MTIGYLTNDLVNDYNCSLWEGIDDACRRMGVSFLSFVGGEIDSPYTTQAMRNNVFKLVGSEVVDGIVLNATSLFGFMTPSGVAKFMSAFRGMPVVTHGVRCGDLPAVTVDNASGSYQATVHLLRDHGLRSIGYIGGPRNNGESIERMAGYEKALREFGIEPDRDLMEAGNFITDLGGEALERILSSGKKVEAAVCANDDMARGAMAVAERMGLRVPGDLAIIGFDDNPFARNLRVPLASVRQPLYEQGKRSAELLARWIAGGVRPENLLLPTKLLPRRSCGCISGGIAAADGPRPPEARSDEERSADERRRDVFRQTFASVMDGADRITAIEALDRRMREDSAGGFDASGWQESLTEAMRELPPAAGARDERAELFFHQARMAVQDLSLNLMSSSVALYEQRITAMRDLYTELANSFDLGLIFDVMWRRLPRLDVEACYVAFYEGSPASGRSRLMFGYDGGARLPLPEEGLPFDTAELLPEAALSGSGLSSFSVEALYFKDEHFGFALMRAHPRKVVFTALWRQVAASLKGSILLRELRYKEKALEALLEDQRLRGAELEAANKELESFSYSVSHDLRAPLRAMDGFARILLEKYAPSLPPEAVRLADKIIASSNQMGRLIDGLLAFSRFSRQELAVQPVSMRDLAQDALNVFREDIERNGFSVKVGQLMDCHGDPTLLRQVWANLISNAVKFTRGAPDPRIEIGYEEIDGEQVYYVRDDGVGFDMRYSDKLFGVFQRLHRLDEFEGTGIGLATVARILKRHQGRIWAESEPGRGATFFFTVE